LDRYLEIDPARNETSIETGLPVYNVVNVRAQPGSAGTILNNLSALGVGRIFPVGFCGPDGEGHELRESLRTRRGVVMEHFLTAPERCTFTYCKPLIVAPGRPPRELNRLDRKNWTPTPAAVQDRLIKSLYAVADEVDAMVVMDQVDIAGTGVVSPAILEALHTISRKRRALPVIADSRRGVGGFPKLIFKMNAGELAVLLNRSKAPDPRQAIRLAGVLARENGRKVFVTLAGKGIVGADPTGRAVHVPAWPVRGPIDIVGAGDAVTANLVAALAMKASLEESLALASAAASIVIHQLGTTGTADVAQLAGRLGIRATGSRRPAPRSPRRSPRKAP
jgi:bifunctional ADP-heptose synthase (sugar kinase/adenylyltransferase)